VATLLYKYGYGCMGQLPSSQTVYEYMKVARSDGGVNRWGHTARVSVTRIEMRVSQDWGDDAYMYKS
jgi:hypothetical protein